MKRLVEVRQTVEVELDESKFTPEFMHEFREHFYGFLSVEQHIQHVAQLEARGLLLSESFIEGYGDPKEFGIRAKVIDAETEIML